MSSTRVGLVSVVSLGLAGLLVACSGNGGPTTSSGGSPSGTTPPGGDPKSDVPPGTADPASGDPASGTTDPPAKALAAPSIDGIMKMGGALHVVWTLPADVTCDKVTLERKTATTDYKVAYTLPGSADNKHDAAATQNTTYTYRVQCFVGAAASPYSNEKSANPAR